MTAVRRVKRNPHRPSDFQKQKVGVCEEERQVAGKAVEGDNGQAVPLGLLGY